MLLNATMTECKSIQSITNTLQLYLFPIIQLIYLAIIKISYIVKEIREQIVNQAGFLSFIYCLCWLS